jgi:hypothetical protein
MGPASKKAGPWRTLPPAQRPKLLNLLKKISAGITAIADKTFTDDLELKSLGKKVKERVEQWYLDTWDRMQSGEEGDGAQLLGLLEDIGKGLAGLTLGVYVNARRVVKLKEKVARGVEEGRD